MGLVVELLLVLYVLSDEKVELIYDYSEMGD